MQWEPIRSMPLQAILAARAFTPHDEIPDAVILVEDGVIVAMGRREEVPIPAKASRYDAATLTVAPGFIDVHIHGAGGHDVMEGTPEALDAVARTVARHGTTSLVATTVTAGAEETCRAVAGIANWMKSQAAALRDGDKPRAEILGIHFEGPFISPQRRGVHPPEWIVPPSVNLLRTFAAAAEGAGRILTLAPELPEAMELIVAAREAGLVVSMGHTDASYAEAISAIQCGARHAAHVFNAMRPFEHRETGVIGAVLTSPDVTAELIADGVHVQAAAMRLLLSAKGSRNVILVSDGTAATGMPDGTYRLGTFDVTVLGGVCRNAERKLAGSTLTLDRALRNMVALDVKLADALAMLTANPARLLGLEGRKGTLVAGADADLVLLDAGLAVAGVMTRGLGFRGGE
jgi:N-acetylglucosamine-6-phosphate deacetylase